MQRNRTLVIAGLSIIASIALLRTIVPRTTAWSDLRRFAYAGFGHRDRWQHPADVIAALGIPKGARVADLGAGGGYFTFRLAEAVGPTGTVYAIDVDETMLRYIAERADAGGLRNIRTILARPDDPRLPLCGVDLVFSANTFHHLRERATYFRRAGEALHVGGRVAIIDYTGHGYGPPAFLQRITGHFAGADTIRAEMEAAGYVLRQAHGFLPRQSFLVFTPRGTERGA